MTLNPDFLNPARYELAVPEEKMGRTEAVRPEEVSAKSN